MGKRKRGIGLEKERERESARVRECEEEGKNERRWKKCVFGKYSSYR